MDNPKVLMGVGGVVLLLGLGIWFARWPFDIDYFGPMATIAGALLLGGGLFKYKQENY